MDRAGGLSVRYLSLLIKPASGRCNMRCGYCFYRQETESRAVADRGLMSMETAEQLVRRAFEAAKEGVSFAFQGGEPTLAGLDFFRGFTELARRYNTRGLRVDYSIQTNGLLLDEDFCAFLRENGFLTGLSLDGYAAVHDAARRDAAENGTFDRVLAAAERLRANDADFNVLCVVTNRTAKRGAAVYNWYRGNGFRYLQFIPCLNGPGRGPTPGADSVTPENYGKFLIDVFDRWYADYTAGTYVSVRAFDNWVRMLLGHEPETCSMAGRCTAYGCVEADGSVYPCDFYVLDEWLLGNVRADGFAAMLEGETARRFVAGSEAKNEKCAACRWRALCRGGCRRSRDADGANELCRAYELFFSHAWERLADIAQHQ